MKKNGLAIADFEDERKSQAKECRWPAESRRGKEMKSPIEPPMRTQLCQHLHCISPFLHCYEGIPETGSFIKERGSIDSQFCRAGEASENFHGGRGSKHILLYIAAGRRRMSEEKESTL